MADQDLNNNSAPEVGGNNTKTRKTVRLAPSIAPASGLKLPGKEDAAGASIADPLANRDTDTGNLEVLDDTQTRRTVKLKPIRPQGSNVPDIDLAGDSGSANTNTRKSVVLAPAGSTPAAGGDGSSTNTRKTVVLKPASAVPPAVGGDGNSTNTRKTVVLKPAGAINVPVEAPADDRTVKIQRPPKTAVNVSPAPAPMPAPSMTEEPISSRATVALPDEEAPNPAPSVDDATQSNTTIKPAAAPGISIEPIPADDRTVKIQRPSRTALKPVATPVPENDVKLDSPSSRATVVLPDDNSSAETVMLDDNDIASRATVVLPDIDENTATQQNAVLRDNAGNETVSLTTQDLTEAAAELAQKSAEEETPEIIDNSSAQTVSFDEGEIQDEEDSSNGAEFTAEEENAENFIPDVSYVPEQSKGSPVYLVLIILTLLAVAFTAAVTTIDDLSTWKGVKIDLPIPGLKTR